MLICTHTIVCALICALLFAPKLVCVLKCAEKNNKNTKVYWPLACVLLLLYPARALMVSIMLADLLCPTSRSPSSPIRNKIHYNSRGAAHPLCSGRKAATPR